MNVLQWVLTLPTAGDRERVVLQRRILCSIYGLLFRGRECLRGILHGNEFAEGVEGQLARSFIVELRQALLAEHDLGEKQRVPQQFRLHAVIE